MPAGNCRFPEHHSSPSADPPLALIAALVAGALVLAFWHAILVVLAVGAGVAVVLGVMVSMWHTAHKPSYDEQLALTARRAALPSGASASDMQTDALTAQAERPAIAPPQYHLHFHGLDPEQMAEVVTRQVSPHAALEEHS